MGSEMCIRDSYNGDKSFLIRLIWLDNAQGFQRRNSAGDMWEDVINVAPGVPGKNANLPSGTAVRTGLKWDSVNGVWESVSTITTVYYALTRENTFASLQEALLHALGTEGTSYPPYGPYADDVVLNPWSTAEGYSYNVFEDTETTHKITNVWPENGEAPYAWVISPASEDWIPNFKTRYGENGAIVDMPDMVVRRDFMRINGTPYDVSSVQLTGTRPPHDSGSQMQLIYTSPAETAPSILQGV